MTAAPAIGGTVPAATAELRERVREAAAARRVLRVVGGGTWLDAIRPVAADDNISTGALTGVVEYVPGDLTLTARAGTTLSEIARVAAEHRQWLALDPIGDPERATIGATIATSSYGPVAHHFGTPRDMTLGVEMVTGVGDIVRGGGRVVKNVAGFDLTRLVTGSWGTLGIVTEVSVRLRALPAMETTLAVDIANDTASIERVRSALRRLPFTPLAAQLLSRAIADRAGVGGSGLVLLFRVGGNEEAVRSQRQGLGGLGAIRECPMTSWNAVRAPEARDTAVVRLSRLPSRFAETWQDALALVKAYGGHCHGDPGRGVVRCVLSLTDDRATGALRQWLEAPFAGTRIYERLPRELWTSVPVAGHARLSRDIKRAFDPAGVLNPGLLGDLS